MLFGCMWFLSVCAKVILNIHPLDTYTWMLHVCDYFSACTIYFCAMSWNNLVLEFIDYHATRNKVYFIFILRSQQSTRTPCFNRNTLFPGIWISFWKSRWSCGHIYYNSFYPNDAIWWQRSGSTLVQVMASCLTAPNHYLNQYWLIISKAQWHPFAQKIPQLSRTKLNLKCTYPEFHSNLPENNELIRGIPVLLRLHLYTASV